MRYIIKCLLSLWVVIMLLPCRVVDVQTLRLSVHWLSMLYTAEHEACYMLVWDILNEPCWFIFILKFECLLTSEQKLCC